MSLGSKARCALIDFQAEYSITDQCRLLGVHRSKYYHKPKENEARQDIEEFINELYKE